MNPKSIANGRTVPANELTSQRAARTGFTLLEFLIYISVLSVMATIIGGSFLSLTSGRAKNESRAEVSASIKSVMDRIKDDLKNATNIVVPSVGTNYPALAVVVNADLVSYYLNSSGAVIRRVNDTEVVITTPRVRYTGLNFEYIQNVSLPLLKIVSNIKVSLTSASATNDPARAYSQMAESTFSLGRLFDIVRPSGLFSGQVSPAPFCIKCVEVPEQPCRGVECIPPVPPGIVECIDRVNC